MPIKPPGKHPFAPWLQDHRALTGKGGKHIGAADLLLTPLIDMFVILVVFLIMNFSATGELVSINKDITLPKAKTVKEMERAPIIEISKKDILLEGSFVESYDNVMEDEDLRIPTLTDKLRELKATEESQNSGKPFKGQIIINCDKEVNFKAVRKVMFAASEAEYLNFNYAVLKDESNAEGAAGAAAGGE